MRRAKRSGHPLEALEEQALLGVDIWPGLGGPKRLWSEDFGRLLVSHYSANGDTISCDGLLGDRLQRQAFLRYPPYQVCLWIAIGHF